jgi:hypothetical protein
VELHNTSPADGGGFLTAIAFDNPGGRITGAALSSTNPNFQLLGQPGDGGRVPAPPFGDFDLGASTSGKFLGGGSPGGGIGAGESATFTFDLSGQGLDELSAESFLGEPPATAGGDLGPAAFVARFRGFGNGGSDKVPGYLADTAPPPGSEEVPGEPAGPAPPPSSNEEPGGPIGPVLSPGSNPPSVPEPASLVLAGIAASAGLGYGWRTRGRPGNG